jgi:hypothetical protein
VNFYQTPRRYILEHKSKPVFKSRAYPEDGSSTFLRNVCELLYQTARRYITEEGEIRFSNRVLHNENKTRTNR